MGWIENLAAGLGSGQRAGITLDQQAANALFGLEDTHSGKHVTPETAMHLVPVYSAVSLLAGSVGSLPLLVYANRSEGRVRAESHRAWSILHDKPNDGQTADELWEWVMAQLALWGNAYLAKERNRLGTVFKLWPIPASLVQVERKNGKHLYRFGESDRVYDSMDVLHFRGLGSDGVVGYSPIYLARQALGNAMAQEEYQGRFWRNSARPSGMLTTDGELNDKARTRITKAWKAAHAGPVNAGKTAVMEQGIKWEALGLPLADAEFVEQAKLGRTDVALLFRIPPGMLSGHKGDSMTYATTETESLDFVKWSLRRWLVRIEKTLKHDPGLFPQQGHHFAEFLVDGLLRADTLSRYRAYSLGIKAGFLAPNEPREWENLPRKDGGDELQKPSLTDDDLKDDGQGGQEEGQTGADNA